MCAPAKTEEEHTEVPLDYLSHGDVPGGFLLIVREKLDASFVLKKFFTTPHLSECEDTFLNPNHAALHHDKVIIHFTVVGEASLQREQKNGGQTKKQCLVSLCLKPL